jgi:hypothetical protein
VDGWMDWMDDGTDGWKASRKTTTTSFTILYKYAPFVKENFKHFKKYTYRRDPKNDSLFISVCILRDLPQQKNPRA